MDQNLLDTVSREATIETHMLSHRALPFVFHTDCVINSPQHHANKHKELEILMCISGSGTVYSDMKAIQLVPGEMAVINTNRIHYSTTESEFRYHCLIIDNDFLYSIGIDTDEVCFEDKIASPCFSELFDKICIEWHRDDKFKSVIVKSIVAELCVRMCRDHIVRDTNNEKESKILKKIKYSINYIKQNFRRDLSLEEVSDAAGLSRYHFCREFKKSTGLTPVEFINRTRCEFAKELLESKKYTIAEISDMSGFVTPAHFSKTFKGIFGVHPSEHLKRAKQSQNVWTSQHRLLHNSSTDPFYNLALEEWLMKNCDEDVIVLWQNSPTVVIGRYQNAYAEVNIPYAEKNGISVVRRMSGGGAVYHDSGNLNFTFIVNDDGNGIDFARFLAPIKEALASLGIETEISGRNDLLMGGKKISGSAQCRKYGKVLHHGTLLVDVDADVLSSVLNVNAEKLTSKGISSVRSRVTNIKDVYPDVTVSMIDCILTDKLWGRRLELTDKDKSEIKLLADEKYSSWEYVYGSSKALSKTVSARFDGGSIQISFDSENGVIKDARINGDFFADGEIALLEEALNGCRLSLNDLIAVIDNTGCKIHGITSSEIAETILK
ncbi:MAG: lipoate--protein ligase [Ruminococcaceae bacterium]|nr:lipoate--protein ligase [Oscillospiraceae bacterium]